MRKLLHILLFVPLALVGQDLINIDINSNAIEYTDITYNHCYEHFTIPSTQIDVKLELIKEIYVSYDLSSSIKCGGQCRTIWLEIDIIHDEETLYEYLLDECDIEGTSGNIIFNTNFSSPDYVMPTINFITADISNNSIFVVDSIKYLPPVGCMNQDAINFDETATIYDEESCIYSQEYVHGLWNEVDDGAIEYEYLQEEYNSLNANAINSTSSLQQALETWSSKIVLAAGWNMFGYGCPAPIDLVQAMSEYTDNIIILKDNSGKVYMPEFGFNGIGDLIPGLGYQIKITEAIEGFSLCDWYVNDIPEDNIISLQEENASMKAKLDCYENPQIGDYCFGGIIFHVNESDANTKYGLVTTDSLIGLGTHYDAIVMVENYENDGFDDWQLPSMNQLNLIYENLYLTGEVNYETEDIYNWYWAKNECTTNSSNVASDIHFVDGSFQYCNNADSNPGGILPIRAFGDWIMGCTDSTACNFNPEANMSDGSCEYAEEGYDCEGNEITYQVGDFAQGGIVFYVDETSKHGLVAALEDLGSFEWGCNEETVNGADGYAIGTGYQNTMDIVNQGCTTGNGGVTAAQAALHVEINGHTDWYLPSIDELKLVFHNIAHGAVTNITNLNDGSYMSSTELSATMADGMNFWTNNAPSSFVAEDAGNIGPQFKNALYLICPIRSF